MRLSVPRIAPADFAQLPPETVALLEARGGFAGKKGPLNVLTTIANSPKALKRYLLWSDYVLGSNNSLSPRLREIIILRVGWLCRSGYEWTQHGIVGRDCGLSDGDVERVKRGGGASGWSSLESATLNATDQLINDHHMGDEVWSALDELGDRGRMDLVFTCGTYVMISMLLNSAGVQLDPGQRLDPAFWSRDASLL